MRFCIALFVVAMSAISVQAQVPPPVVYATDVDTPCNPTGPCTDLRWVVVNPVTPGQVPAIVCEEGGRFKNGRFLSFGIIQDLANAGYIAIAAERRLAPPHTEMSAITGPGDPQIDPPSKGQVIPDAEQTSDIRRAIRAARALPKCNGKVGFLGSSGAGSLGPYWGILGTANDDKPDAIVSMSGPFDLQNAQILAQPPEAADLANYVGDTIGSPTWDANSKAGSSYWQTPPAGTTPSPLYAINSTSEIIPSTELTNMITKYTGFGATMESDLRIGSEHATNYWNLGCTHTVGPDGCGPGLFPTVKQAVINFFQRNIPSGAAGGPAQIILAWKGAGTVIPQATEVYGYGTNLNNTSEKTTLYWTTLVHPEATKRPVGILIHIGDFRQGLPGPISVALDLYNAGYQVCMIEHRLAPPGIEMRNQYNNQPVDDAGQAPEQVNDVSAAIIAARNGTTPSLANKVTGKVFGVGGDSGGTHVAYFAGAALNTGDKLDAGVMISAYYNFRDSSSFGADCTISTSNSYHDNVTNYLNCDPNDIHGGCPPTDVVSPFNRFTSSSSPVIFFNTNNEAMPSAQYTLFHNYLVSVSAPFDSHSRLITEPAFQGACTRHAFQLWRSPGATWPDQVKTDTLTFLTTNVPPP